MQNFPTTGLIQKVSKLFIACAAFGLLSNTALAECNYPDSIPVPDGSTASEAELVATQTAIKQYMASMEGYLACLDEEAAALGPEITEDQIRIRDLRHDAAVDEMEKLAAEFNAAVRAFKKNSAR